MARPKKNASTTIARKTPKIVSAADFNESAPVQQQKPAARIRQMPAPTRTRPDNLSLQGLTTKRTRVILRVQGEGVMGQQNILLWSNEDSPDAFHGGMAELQRTEDGKALLAIPKEYIQLNGKSYFVDAEPITMHVQRTESNGRIRGLAVFKNKKQVGEIKLRKSFVEKNSPLVGVFNFKGLKFDDQFHVVDTPDNVMVTAEILGGLRDEVIAMYQERAAAIEAKKTKVPRKYTKRGSKGTEEMASPESQPTQQSEETQEPEQMEEMFETSPVQSEEQENTQVPAPEPAQSTSNPTEDEILDDDLLSSAG